jgi:squalene-hopene/tetraprenyl-beta-curcumene cyclase
METVMRRRGKWCGAAVLAACLAGTLCGVARAESAAPSPANQPGAAATPAPAPQVPAYEKQAGEAIDRGLHFLHAKLQSDGSWEKNPGITGIVLLGFLKSGKAYSQTDDPFVRKPLEYLLSLQKPDGGIYERELANYNTSIAIQVLIATKNPKYDGNIKKARGYLLGSQLDERKGCKPGDLDYGGGSYGDKPKADLSNTQMWASALHAAEKAGLAKDSEAWRRMTVFVSRCQNRSESNDQKWASNDGGFVYAPGESKAGEVMLPDGRKGLRSYASMTYAGLMSMIYADVTKDDPRVQAAYEWIRKNYTVDENPGLGPQGLFYYYHTMAKALKAWDDPVLADEKGVRHDWRSDLTEKLLSLQKPDGSWVNANDRWWEKNPVLVTAYVVLTLEELLEK